MGKQVWKQALLLIFGFIAFILPAHAQAAAQEALPQIIVNLPSRTLELYKGNALVKEYQVAIGKPDTPTPTGEFSIIDKEIDPAWYPPGKGYVVPSGPSNPLGYRWMGIGSLYGIHGTNAPWSIGLAVSNGCIRMQEADAEEIFELVGPDTPVKIEYERIKVRIDTKGQASIGIYPDVYSRQKVTLAGVKAALGQAGLDDLVDDAFLQTLIKTIPDRQVMFAQLHNLKINGTLRPERIISWKGKKHVPVLALADSLRTNVVWNAGNQTVTRQNQTVPGVKRGNTVYVNIDHLPILFGGREIWNDSQNCLELMLPIAKFDGHILSGDIQRIGNTLAIPALTVAKELGERVTWRPNTAELLIHGKPTPVKLIGGQPFITINDIGKVYNMAAVWDDQTQIIDLVYPLYPIDYSMYLDPGEEYL
ncbi:L,D-transpeptidase family protein [Sporomusa sp.]|uniref:L,D-transpeptidase family protein n=1 Tax=Sporomusa sp. TaxID=2078658 RepID=UPI002C4F3742|nr:L,D-transpeptidase family protein [Sporomusa sp.]HWR44799.1 L,D-transpeptidase family protein [Sporomusa sp.]